MNNYTTVNLVVTVYTYVALPYTIRFIPNVLIPFLHNLFTANFYYKTNIPKAFDVSAFKEYEMLKYQ